MNNDKLTIAGPKPATPENKKPQKKVNVETILLMAKYDEEFKEKLFADRNKALSESGLNFTPGEKLLLNNISNEQLAENIMEFMVPGVTKKSLPNWAKATAVILLLSSIVVTGAEGRRREAPVSEGISPDYGPPMQMSRITEIRINKNDFTQFTVFTTGMLKIINDIELKLKSEIKIGDIMDEYDSFIRKESEKTDNEKTIKPEDVKLISEIEEKIKSGMDANDVIKKYEEIIYITH